MGLFLTLQQEPLGQATYLAGIHLTLRQDLRAAVLPDDVAPRFVDGSRTQPCVWVAREPADVPRIRREFIQVLHGLITGVDGYNAGRDWAEQLSLQAYVLTEQERTLLIAWLLESLQDAEQPELAEQAMALLFHFQAPELLVAESHPDREVPFPVVVLQEALQHVLALPVDVSYTLPESLEALGSRFRYRRNDYYHFALGNNLRAEAIHAAWYRGRPEQVSEIEDQARAYLRAVRELLQSVRSQAAEAIFAWAAKFALPARASMPIRCSRGWRSSRRYESLLDCLSLRQARCEPRAVQLLTSRVMELRATGDGEFEILGGASLPLDPGGFPEWLLVTDDDEGRRAQLEYRDYACRARLWQGQPQPNLAVVGVTDLRRDKFGRPAASRSNTPSRSPTGPPSPTGGTCCTRGSRITPRTALSRSCRTTGPCWNGWTTTNSSCNCCAIRRRRVVCDRCRPPCRKRRRT